MTDFTPALALAAVLKAAGERRVTLLVCTTILSALADALTAAVGEIGRLTRDGDQRAEKAEANVRTQARDWSEDHDHLQELCRKAGIPEEKVVGDSYGVPGIGDLVDMLAAECERLKKSLLASEQANARWRECEPVDGDYVCGHQAYAEDLEKRLATAEADARAAREELANAGCPNCNPAKLYRLLGEPNKAVTVPGEIESQKAKLEHS